MSELTFDLTTCSLINFGLGLLDQKQLDYAILLVRGSQVFMDQEYKVLEGKTKKGYSLLNFKQALIEYGLGKFISRQYKKGNLGF